MSDIEERWSVMVKKYSREDRDRLYRAFYHTVLVPTAKDWYGVVCLAYLLKVLDIGEMYE